MAGVSSDQPDAERTIFTLRALDFSMIFNGHFANKPVGGDMMRIPTVIEPEGMSTGRGAVARQPMVLQGPDKSVPAITVGWVDTAQDTAHIKSYDYLLQKHQARRGDARFGVAESGYTAFYQDAMRFMHQHNIACTTDQEYGGTRTHLTRKSASRTQSNPLVFAAAAIIAVGLAGLLYYFFIIT